MRRLWACLILAILLSGCSNSVELAIEQYQAAVSRIELGMWRDEVLVILGPTQKSVPLEHRKTPEMYFQSVDGHERFIEVFYYRSATNYDGIITDDEFTPYIFYDGKLAAIGWEALDGPASEMKTTDDQHLLKFE